MIENKQIDALNTENKKSVEREKKIEESMLNNEDNHKRELNILNNKLINLNKELDTQKKDSV